MRRNPRDRDLVTVLGRARELGFLGPADPAFHIGHAEGFVELLTRQTQHGGIANPLVLDLGSGGGVPGLVIAVHVPSARVVLLDGNGRRAAFLEESVEWLGLRDRVQTRCGRAEEVAHDPTLRGTFDTVVARSFGAPAPTAECGLPFLRVGGLMVVSEPPLEDGSGSRPVADAEMVPADEVRWPAEGLALLGAVSVGAWRGPFGYMVIRLERPCPARFPRRNGVPAKRPLFGLR